MQRRKTKMVMAGGVPIGGGSPVTVQSMLCAPAHDFEANLAQAKRLRDAGCSIIRVAIPDKETVPLIPKLKELGMPVVADIHFDYRLAIESVAAGADKIRINPGNIGGEDRVKAVADACKLKGVPIRVGVNSGSIERDILAKYGKPTPQAMCESAMRHVKLLNKYDFDDIVISLKSSDVQTMVEAYELLSEMCDYPLHLGVTEAGTGTAALIKSAVGIGSLLMRGIGDTIRVSLTDDPAEEVKAGIEILRAAGLYNRGVQIISCPTCGRTKVDIIKLAKEASKRLAAVDKPLKVAIMGCAVNGPGEAREADIGLAGGDGQCLIFKNGKILRKVPEAVALDELMAEIEKM
ncbi:4-hydroxy-3-methylbut-2-en-1-yl diphosphate synthase [[Clostridium] cellulosi]|uniref:4-hydroxy-3-methylbut-2-en-1-yl diphosphate synthase (flavodoxin) n=1 Tax=[Clostridium] cellulosi TaxID=29343 RepID=A0A078KQD9_9FIRM|nr:MAG: flavodoxin-dependent (E)-4-hydroxy-3-methylbut-2-enyl-diphosphate synthase [[Clostridium] cellulosi]CDZ24752.1 4-hydroxy-3-methylbut-2-en-1-yl diphosphate synthase [[Clostridium] cellulosi]